jgi:hypothetical protein
MLHRFSPSTAVVVHPCIVHHAHANPIEPGAMGIGCQSGRGYQDIGGGQGIKADGAAVDLDHALLAASLAQQFQFATRQHPEVGHLGAGFPVTVDGTHTQAPVAAGFRQGRPCLGHSVAAPLAAMAQGWDITQHKTGVFGLILGHEHERFSGYKGSMLDTWPRTFGDQRKMFPPPRSIGQTCIVSYSKQWQLSTALPRGWTRPALFFQERLKGKKETVKGGSVT